MWPGNDFDLLSDRLGLSVDEVSRDPEIVGTSRHLVSSARKPLAIFCNG